MSTRTTFHLHPPVPECNFLITPPLEWVRNRRTPEPPNQEPLAEDFHRALEQLPVKREREDREQEGAGGCGPVMSLLFGFGHEGFKPGPASMLPIIHLPTASLHGLGRGVGVALWSHQDSTDCETSSSAGSLKRAHPDSSMLSTFIRCF